MNCDWVAKGVVGCVLGGFCDRWWRFVIGVVARVCGRNGEDRNGVWSVSAVECAGQVWCYVVLSCALFACPAVEGVVAGAFCPFVHHDPHF